MSRDHRLVGGWLLAARTAWFAIAVPTLVMAAAGFAAAIERPLLAGARPVDQALAEAGIPPHWTLLGLLLPVLALSAGTGVFIFWRRSDDWMALLASLMLVLFGAYASRSLIAVQTIQPALHLASLLLTEVGLIALIMWTHLFPDGRFVPRWTGWIAAATVAALVLTPDAGEILLLLPDGPEGVPVWRTWAIILVLVGNFGVVGFSQAHRFARVSRPIERQQTKWITFAVLVGAGWFVLALGAPSLLLPGGAWQGWVMLAGAVFVALIPISIALAVLRYRLYDIDVVIRRTLVYGALTGTLALTSWVGVILLQQALRTLTQGSELAIVGGTLVVVGLFQPARQRLQSAVDRRFYRRKYDAARTLEQFGARLRQDVDLESLSGELVAVVRQTVQPARAFLWLRPTVVTFPERSLGRKDLQ